MSHISTHYSGKIRISEGDKKITVNSECKDTLLMIRDYIVSEWKEINSCVISKYDSTAKREQKYTVGDYKFDTLKECADILDSVKWIEFMDEEKKTAYQVNIASREIVWDKPADKCLGCAEVMQLMNIQNELNIEVNGENLKIENHVDAVERMQKEEANSKVDDYISHINNHPNEPQKMSQPHI